MFREPRVLALSVDSPFAGTGTVSIEQLMDQPFVARKGPDAWRDHWLATDCRDGHPVRVGAWIGQLEECLEAVISGRGIGFTQISTLSYYSRPGLTAIPVLGLPPSELAIAWRADDESELVRDLVETARMVAASTRVPQALGGPARMLVPLSTSGSDVPSDGCPSARISGGGARRGRANAVRADISEFQTTLK